MANVADVHNEWKKKKARNNLQLLQGDIRGTGVYASFRDKYSCEQKK